MLFPTLIRLKFNAEIKLRQGGVIIQKRFKKKKKRNNEKTNIDRALDYFDKVYHPVYENKWKIIKKSLFAETKYAALINNFSNHEEILENFQESGAYDVGAFYTETIKNYTNEDVKNGVVDSAVYSNVPENIEDPQSNIRPSLIELTDDEKAALANKNIDRYPEVYKQGVRAASDEPEEGLTFSRLIKSSQIPAGTTAKVYDYIPATKLKNLDDWHEEADVMANAKETEREIGVNRTTEKMPLPWPKHLKVYSFVKGEKLAFPQPLPCSSLKVFTHYLMNGSSILPVLALDLQSGDVVLDMCSSPGGKALAVLQTYLPGSLTCNDLSLSRVNRIRRVMDQYVPETFSSIRDILTVSQADSSVLNYQDCFDKVLVDAPCLNDRLSLQESDNSIFKPGRMQDRLKLPELQASLILAALKCTKPGGCVVYSTCTLAPLQNDGAVHLALTRVWRETKMDCTVVNMLPTMKSLSFMYKFGHDLGLRYGHVVLPSLDNNYGPMYICKINKDR